MVRYDIRAKNREERLVKPREFFTENAAWITLEDSILFIGGNKGEQSLKAVWKIKDWKAVPSNPMVIARACHAAVYLNKVVYCFGGRDRRTSRSSERMVNRKWFRLP